MQSAFSIPYAFKCYSAGNQLELWKIWNTDIWNKTKQLILSPWCLLSTSISKWWYYRTNKHHFN